MKAMVRWEIKIWTISREKPVFEFTTKSDTKRRVQS